MAQSYPSLRSAPPRPSNEGGFVRRVLTVFGVALAIGLVLWLVWLSFYVLMLILAGLLLAVLLRGTSDRLSRATKIPAGWSLAVVSLGTIALVIFGVVQLAPELAAQIQQLINTIPVALQQLPASVEQYDWL